MSDDAWQVRQQAVSALGHKGSSSVDVVAPLAEVMRRDGDARVRATAANALWHNANARAFPALMEALKDDDRSVREAAARTLGNRVGNDDVPLLIAALRDNNARVRQGARRALEIVRQRSQGQQTNLRPLPPGVPE
jgi:HEAT repeat protein